MHSWFRFRRFVLAFALLTPACFLHAQEATALLLRLEAVEAEFKAAYAPGALARTLRAQSGEAQGLDLLDAAASKAFRPDAALAAIGRAVAAAKGDAVAGQAAVRAVARLQALRRSYGAMDERQREAFLSRHLSKPVDARRSDLLARMAVVDLREIDRSNQLLLEAVLRTLRREGPGQIEGLPEPMLIAALDALWARGTTSQRARNQIAVAREFERLRHQALLAALPDADVAALLAWRSGEGAEAQRRALVDSYREEVKAGGLRTIRALVRAWPRR